MTIRFHDSLITGSEEELFDELRHDEYEGYSNTTGTKVKKADLKSFMMASTRVLTHKNLVLLRLFGPTLFIIICLSALLSPSSNSTRLNTEYKYLVLAEKIEVESKKQT